MCSRSVLIGLESGVRIIKFNRPEKKNAFTPEMYHTITSILNQDAKDDAVLVTILTGEGEYYSSGNDLTALDPQNMDASFKIVYNFVNAFIQYPKLLIAVVNGPAIGIAVTCLALCDIVYASNTATFETPFVKLGLCAEGCSSYMFPRIMGKSFASEMLLLGRKLNAEEAYHAKLVSRVVERSRIGELIESLKQYGKLPAGSLKASKRLVNANLTKILRECNRNEIETLEECVQSEEFGNRILAFMSRKRNSKL